MLWGTFSLAHILSLVFAVILNIGLYFILKKCPKWLQITILGILSLSGIAAIIYNLVAWNSPLEYLPFHLCSIQILFIFIIVYANSPKIKELLLSFMIPSCLFGGIAALLIPTESSLNGRWILSVQYFGYHVAIIIFALTLLRGEQLQLTFRHYVNCLKFLLGLMLFGVYINSILYDGVSNINFMYVVSPPKSGLPFLNEDHGWLVYVVHYVSLIIFCVTLCYIKPIIVAIRAHRKQK